jgi:hypothetical protein
MSERTVTEQQVIDVFNMPFSLDQRICLNLIFSELFPELPKVGELIKPWDGDEEPDLTIWRTFHGLTAIGIVQTSYFDGDFESLTEWDNYRRQTPAERGES